MSRVDRLGSNLLNGGVIGTRDDEGSVFYTFIGSSAVSDSEVTTGTPFTLSIFPELNPEQTNAEFTVSIDLSSGTVLGVTTDSLDTWSETGWAGGLVKTNTFTKADAVSAYALTFTVTPGTAVETTCTITVTSVFSDQTAGAIDGNSVLVVLPA